MLVEVRRLLNLSARVLAVWAACSASLLIAWAAASEARADMEACKALSGSRAEGDVQVSDTVFRQAADAAPAHCEVRGTIGGNINFAVLMPEGWNTRFLMVGNGGKAGELEIEDASLWMSRGFATATTDTGHDDTIPEQAGAKFGVDPDMELDFGYRAVHETAVTAKAILADYYAGPAERAYWVGCSTGGRQGMMEAQRFPEDFDGYLIGAPVHNYTLQQMSAPAYLRALYKSDPFSDVPAVPFAKLALLGETTTTKCDLTDGLEDGLISDPLACDVSAERDLPVCDTDGEDCFTQDEIEAISKIYAGVRAADGSRIVHGLPVSGEALRGSWGAWLIAPPGGKKPPLPLLHTVMYDAFNYLMFEDDRPDYNYMTEFDFATDIPAMSRASDVLDATDPDLDDVTARGSKIIMYHGWGDAASNPLNSIDYYDAVKTRRADADEFLKLYLIPGMTHCRGGIGFEQVDWFSALQSWVEDGVAPDAVIGTRPADGATRPHCPYPRRALYDGSGDPKLAASFVCGE